MRYLDPDKTSSGRPETRLPDGIVTGGILLALGLLLLLSEVVDWSFMPTLILPAIALVFLVGGVLGRRLGLLIAGCITAGVASGVVLADSDSVRAELSDQQLGALVIFSIALGFLLIMPVAAGVLRVLVWWPVIPGVILGVVGAALLAGPTGVEFLTILKYIWPLALIAWGAYILIRRGRDRGHPVQ